MTLCIITDIIITAICWLSIIDIKLCRVFCCSYFQDLVSLSPFYTGIEIHWRLRAYQQGTYFLNQFWLLSQLIPRKEWNWATLSPPSPNNSVADRLLPPREKQVRSNKTQQRRWGSVSFISHRNIPSIPEVWEWKLISSVTVFQWNLRKYFSSSSHHLTISQQPDVTKMF